CGGEPKLEERSQVPHALDHLHLEREILFAHLVCAEIGETVFRLGGPPTLLAKTAQVGDPLRVDVLQLRNVVIATDEGCENEVVDSSCGKATQIRPRNALRDGTSVLRLLATARCFCATSSRKAETS